MEAPAAAAYAEDGEKSYFFRTSTDTIMGAAGAPMRWIVPGYVGEGLTILAGRQKVGKTWLAINWAAAVASGGMAMGSVACEQGDVLYIDMENGHRRIRARIEALYPDPAQRPDLSRLEWMCETPPLGKGLVEMFEDWRELVAAPRLIVIDAAQRPGWRATAADDSTALPELQRWATKHGVAVVWLHRMRKVGDPFVALGGTGGAFGFADATLLLDRDASRATLQLRSRDGEDRHSALEFGAGVWTVTGEAADVRKSSERDKIIEVLDAADNSLGPSEVAEMLGKPVAGVKVMMLRMEKAGEISRVGHGLYRSPRGVQAAAARKARVEQFVEECRKLAPPGGAPCDAVPWLRDELKAMKSSGRLR